MHVIYEVSIFNGSKVLIRVGPKNKKKVEFPLTQPTLFYRPDSTDFIGKLVDAE